MQAISRRARCQWLEPGRPTANVDMTRCVKSRRSYSAASSCQGNPDLPSNGEKQVQPEWSCHSKRTAIGVGCLTTDSGLLRCGGGDGGRENTTNRRPRCSMMAASSVSVADLCTAMPSAFATTDAFSSDAFSPHARRPQSQHHHLQHRNVLSSSQSAAHDDVSLKAFPSFGMPGFSVGRAPSPTPATKSATATSQPVAISKCPEAPFPCSDELLYDCFDQLDQIEDSLDSAFSGNELVSAESQKKKKKKRRYKVDADTNVNTFNDLYYLKNDILGEGALSSVHTCIEKSTEQEFAVKIVNCVSIDHRRRLLREIEILHLCQHQNHVVRLKEYFEAEDGFFVVFYKANGGPLLEHIRRRRCFNEDEARAVTTEIAEALVFLHHKGIAHRDLKPANILCEYTDQVTPIRICDFDLGSGLYSSQSPPFTPQLGTPVGSCEFMAPEVIAAFANQDLTYDKKCDMWSLGVILFIMLSGRPPFGGGCGGNSCVWDVGGNCVECQDILIEAIKNGEVIFPAEDWDNVSESAKDLIQGLLTQCPRKRSSAAEVLEHPWMTQEVSTTPLNTTWNLKKHGTQTHTIPRLMMAYSVSNLIPRPRMAALSPMDYTAADAEDGAAEGVASGSPCTRKLPVCNSQSSPPYYYQHLNNAVQSAFSSLDDGQERDVFGNVLDLDC